MLFPRNAQIIAVVLALSFLFGTPFQAARAQTGTSKPQDPPAPMQRPDAAKQKPDYSQESVVI